MLARLLLPFGRGYHAFLQSTILPNGYWDYLKFRLGFNKVYWPKDKNCLVANPRKIYVGKNSKIGRPGSYIQGAGGVYIGDYVRFGPNVGILSSNHDLYDRDTYTTKPIIIGDYSWVGMNSLVMAGVKLGPSTIVGGGSVVTKSFPEGYCVIAGNPAKVIKYLDKDKVSFPVHKTKFYGYIPETKFEKIKNKYIDL
jgi:acetyltransferase-like isoleucine patch superfamily enzyme